MAPKKHYDIEFTVKLDQKLEILAYKKGITKAELIRRALALFCLIDEKIGDGQLAIVKKNTHIVKTTIPDF